MVDFSSYIQHGPPFDSHPPIGDELRIVELDESTCNCGSCMSNDKLKTIQKFHYDGVTAEYHPWEEVQYLICPPRVLGYHLKGKRWVELDVEKVADIPNLEDGSSFASLELARPQKTMIDRLVRCHVSGRTSKHRSMTDLTQGKGNGLVILLHGTPPPTV